MLHVHENQSIRFSRWTNAFYIWYRVATRVYYFLAVPWRGLRNLPPKEKQKSRPRLTVKSGVGSTYNDFTHFPFATDGEGGGSAASGVCCTGASWEHWASVVHLVSESFVSCCTVSMVWRHFHRLLFRVIIYNRRVIFVNHNYVWRGSSIDRASDSSFKEFGMTPIRALSETQEKCEFFRVKHVLTRSRCAQPPCTH